MKALIGYRYAVTHGGAFTAVDVFSAAFLCILNPDIKILRIQERDKYANYPGADTLLYDIGLLGVEYPDRGRKRKNGIPYSVFSLLWERFGGLLVTGESVRKFDRRFAQELDAEESGIKPGVLTEVIRGFYPLWDENPNIPSKFWPAMDFAKGILGREISYFVSLDRAQKELDDATVGSDEPIVVVTRRLPWEELRIADFIQFILYPYRGECAIEVIRDHDRKQLSKFPDVRRYGELLLTNTVSNAITLCQSIMNQ